MEPQLAFLVGEKKLQAEAVPRQFFCSGWCKARHPLLDPPLLLTANVYLLPHHVWNKTRLNTYNLTEVHEPKLFGKKGTTIFLYFSPSFLSYSLHMNLKCLTAMFKSAT